MKKEYNKLVRDKIIDIIEKDGKKANWHKIESDEEYLKALNEKLQEEVDEYKESSDIEELIDVVSVVLAILKVDGSNLGELIEWLDEKEEQRGAFNDRIFLESVE